MPLRSLKIAAFLLFVTVLAGRPATAAQAVALSLGFEQDVAPLLRSQLVPITQAALDFLRVFPPRLLGSHFFDWKGDRSELEGKTVTLWFAHWNSPLLDPIRAGPGGMDPEMDSATLAAIRTDANRVDLFVVLMVDKIFYDPQGRERRDSFARLVVALAHEFYGGVQHYLGVRPAGMKPMTLAYRTRVQIESFSAAVQFIQDLQMDTRFPTLPEKTRSDIVALLPIQRKGLATWLSSSGACGSALLP